MSSQLNPIHGKLNLYPELVISAVAWLVQGALKDLSLGYSKPQGIKLKHTFATLIKNSYKDGC